MSEPTSRSPRLLDITLLLFLLLGIGAGAAKGVDESEAPRFGYGLAGGYGYGVVPRDNQRGKDVGEVRYVAIEPHIRLGLARYGDRGDWYRGHLEGLLGGTLLIESEPRSGHAGAGIVGLRYSIRLRNDLDLYGEGGIGVGSLHFELRDQDDGFNFFIHTALGLRYPLNDRLSLTASTLWQHVSNANSRLPNNGIDTVGWRLGIELH